MSRRRQEINAVDSLLAEDEPLDLQQQQEVIAAMMEEQARQQQWKLVFALATGASSLFFLHAARQQHVHPWQQRYTGELRAVTTAGAAAAALGLQALALLLSCAGLLVELPRRGQRDRACMPAGTRMHVLLAAGLAASCAGCCYWSAALWRSVQRFGYETGAKWELSWLPATPLIMSAVCWFVALSVEATGRQVQQLRQLTYDFKRV